MTDQILFETKDHIATITLNRPEALNAFTEEMIGAWVEALQECRDNDDIHVVVLTGAGRAFCAGGDVKAMHKRRGAGDAFAARERLREAHNRLLDLMNLEMPVIVAVDGAAAGAGFSLSLVGDFILASSRAFFVQSFVRIGLVPDWNGLFLLPRLVGLQKAKELMFTGRRIDAAEARELGLVHAVYPAEELMDAAREMARRFCDAPTGAIGLTKNILNQSLHLDPRAVLELEAFAQATARSSDYHKAAVQRFVEKQPALFDWDAAEKRAAKGRSREPGDNKGGK